MGQPGGRGDPSLCGLLVVSSELWNPGVLRELQDMSWSPKAARALLARGGRGRQRGRGEQEGCRCSLSQGTGARPKAAFPLELIPAAWGFLVCCCSPRGPPRAPSIRGEPWWRSGGADGLAGPEEPLAPGAPLASLAGNLPWQPVGRGWPWALLPSPGAPVGPPLCPPCPPPPRPLHSQASLRSLISIGRPLGDNEPLPESYPSPCARRWGPRPAVAGSGCLGGRGCSAGRTG